MKRGFTLIEISIVLIIIGLIVGGILVARSMSDTARLQNTVSELSQYDVATSDFRNKFKYYPGDAPGFAFEGSSNHGNGNGLIEDAGGTPGLGRVWSGEAANFWPELNQVGLRSKSPYVAAVTGKLTVENNPKPNMPSVSIGVTGTGIFVTNDNGYLSTYNISSVYIIGKVTDNDGSDLSFPNTATPTPTQFIKDALKPSDLKALDKKIDDGVANKGKVIAFSEAAAGSPGSCVTTGGAFYNTDLDSRHAQLRSATQLTAGQQVAAALPVAVMLL